eukprot:gene2370-2837_t
MFQWAEIHQDKWKSIRLSFDLNGFLLQSNDIPDITNHVRQAVIIHDHMTLEESLSNYWDPFNHKLKRKLFTYRYNLFTNGKTNHSECYQPLDNYRLFQAEKFDWRCEGYILSPCPKIVKELEFRTVPQIDVPLNTEMRKLLLKRIGLEIQVSKGLLINSCSVLCATKGRVCVKNAFQFVNNCETLQEFFGKKRCVNFVYGNPDYYPGYHWFIEELNTLTEMVSTCDKTVGGYRRACVCGEMRNKKFKFKTKSIDEYLRR